MNQEYCSVQEAAERLGVVCQTVKNYISRGLLPYLCIGKVVSIKIEDLEAFIKKNTHIVDAEISIRKYERELQEQIERLKMQKECARIESKFYYLLRQPYFKSFVYEVLKPIEGANVLNCREAFILRRVIDGASMQQIGEELGLSRERIRQLVMRVARKIGEIPSVYVEMRSENERLQKRCTKQHSLIRKLFRYRHNPQVIETTTDNKDKQAMSIMLVECNLSVRALNCLKSQKIQTVYDLCQITRNDLLKLHFMGKRTVREIEDFLEELSTRTGYEYKLKER